MGQLHNIPSPGGTVKPRLFRVTTASRAAEIDLQWVLETNFPVVSLAACHSVKSPIIISSSLIHALPKPTQPSPRTPVRHFAFFPTPANSRLAATRK